MKAIVLITFMWMGFAAQAAHLGQDSILLKIDKRNQTLIGAKADKSIPLKDELTLVFEKKGLILSDSLWQNIRKTIQSNTDLDSSIRVKMGNSQVKITVIRSDRALLDQQPNASRNKPMDRIAEIGTNNKEVVDIGLKGIHVRESNGEEVHIGWNGLHVKEANGGETRLFWGGDSLKIKQRKEKENFYDRDGMSLYLGLNGLSGKVPSVTTMIYPPNYLQTDTDLKPISSRYVSIEFSESLTLVKGKKSAFRLGLGISFDWYNFMFDHNRMVQKANQGAIFQPIFDTQGKEISFSKNKLTVSYINIPIMPHVVFNKNSGVQMIGLGGYVGYRIDSWTKSIEEKTENLNRFSSNFNLNQFRYGLRAEFAFKKLPNLFFNYDLSPLFEKNSSPNLAGFSFGICLL